MLKPNEKTTILIGPEGDFSLNEIKKALGKNYLPISLGESRLRTETAGLVAVNLVSFINE
jgi:16S rRNA (uracil1498-N3)-methyltransferase